MADVVLDVHNVDSGQESLVFIKEITLEIQNVDKMEETKNE